MSDTQVVPNPVETADPSLIAASPDAPQTTDSPDPQTADPFAEERQRYEADLAAERQRAQAAQEHADRVNAALAQQAAQEWKDQEVRHAQRQAALQQSDPEQALKEDAAFLRYRLQQVSQHNQQLVTQQHQERLDAYADYAVRELGLSPSDKTRILLVGQRDPNAMHIEAERIKAERETGGTEMKAVKARLEQAERALAAAGIRASGAWSTPGSNAQPVATAVKPGSDDQLRELIAGSAGVPG